MSFITWTLDLDTGFADIDDQHKELVDKINKFYDVYQTGNVVDIKIALQELLDYTVFHFDHEEKMLEEANYRMLAQKSAFQLCFQNQKLPSQH